MSDAQKSEEDSLQPKLVDDLRWQLYNDHKKQAWGDIQSSTDSYDQSLLTLSSGALGLSIAFIKDIVGLRDAIWLWLLYFSWVAFAACILTTVISFQVAIRTQEEFLINCGRYYLDGDDTYRDKRGRFSKLLTACTMIAGGLFVLALACTIVFAVGNVERCSRMPCDDKKLQEGRGPVSMLPVPDKPQVSATKPVSTPPVTSEKSKKD